MTAILIHLPVRPGRAEMARLRAIEAAAADLVRKLDEHERCSYKTIRVGAIHALRDAVKGESTPDGAA